MYRWVGNIILKWYVNFGVPTWLLNPPMSLQSAFWGFLAKVPFLGRPILKDSHIHTICISHCDWFISPSYPPSRCRYIPISDIISLWYLNHLIGFIIILLVSNHGVLIAPKIPINSCCIIRIRYLIYTYAPTRTYIYTHHDHMYIPHIIYLYMPTCLICLHTGVSL